MRQWRIECGYCSMDADKHPAQVEVYYEDVTVGYWKTIRFSGALPARKVNELVARVEKL